MSSDEIAARGDSFALGVDRPQTGGMSPRGFRHAAASYFILSLDAVVSIAWGLSLVSALTLQFSVADSAALIFGLALVNFCLVLDLGMTGFAYATFREKYLQGLNFSDLGAMKVVVGAFGVVCLAITAAGLLCSLMVFRRDMAIIFFSLALYSSLVPLWSIISAVGRAVDRYIAYQSAEVGRKIVALLALLAWSKGAISGPELCLAMAFSWLLCGIVSRREMGMICRLDLNRDALPTVFRRAASASRFSLADFIFLQLPYVAAYAHFGLGGHLIVFDLFNKFRRVNALVLSVVVNGAAPVVTREYYSGRKRTAVVGAVTALSLLWLLFLAAVVARFGAEFVSYISTDKIALSEMNTKLLSVGLLLFGVDAYIGMSLVQIGKFVTLWQVAIVKLAAFTSFLVVASSLKLSGELVFAIYCLITLVTPVVVLLKRARLR